MADELESEVLGRVWQMVVHTSRFAVLGSCSGSNREPRTEP